VQSRDITSKSAGTGKKRRKRGREEKKINKERIRRYKIHISEISNEISLNFIRKLCNSKMCKLTKGNDLNNGGGERGRERPLLSEKWRGDQIGGRMPPLSSLRHRFYASRSLSCSDRAVSRRPALPRGALALCQQAV
jgi:hypothetical protein